MKFFVNQHLNYSFVFCFLLLSLFVPLNTSADAFKCIDKQGNTIFQDSECGDNKKETKITIKEYAGNTHCLSNCAATRTICIDDLGFGERNTSRGLLLCENAKQACDTHCYNPDQGRQLEVLSAIERSSYERELHDEQSLRNEREYKKEREKRLAQWDLRKKQRRCNRYKRKLAKVEAKWIRTQEQGRGWTPEEEERYRRRIEDAQDAVRIECE